MDNGLDSLQYMAFPLAPHLHHQYMGQHQHSNNMPLLQAVTQMNQSQSGLGAMQHASSLDFGAQHGPVDPHQHLQGPETSDHLPRRRVRKREETDAAKSKKRQRSKKPVDAPTRPKSAYMFFLGEFREQFKVDNPDSKKVAEVASAAGEKWRSLSEEEKKGYEEASAKAKADYRVVMTEYEKDHPKPPRRQKRARDPSELKRPQSAYFFFLADFRELYKKDHPDEATAVKVIGREAGERWKAMSLEDKEPYELLSTASKAEYARMKQLSPAERIMDGSLIVPAYLDGLGHSQHGMVSHLNAHMGMSPSRDPHMHHGLTQSLQEEEEQYDDDGAERDGEEGRDDMPEESGELDDERAAAQQHQRQQAQLSLTAQLAELAARARAVAASREADAGSPAHHDARHRTNSQLAQADDGQPRLSRSADAEAVGLLNQRRSAHSPSRLEQQEQAQGQDSPEGLSHRPVHVHVIGHTQMPSQLHRQRQQQQQGHSMMPRVAHYHQSPSSMLQYQHYQPELGQSQQQPQGLMLGIHQYQQQHPDGLMQYQHQQGLSAMQQQHQMHGGVGELMGHGMGQQLQDRGQYYGHAEHDAASQPVLPGNYAQWNSPPSGY
ncbi:hypothetical protein ABBQ38_012012 [Trebouxia sp. C0009 RCD-2024]